MRNTAGENPCSADRADTRAAQRGTLNPQAHAALRVAGVTPNGGLGRRTPTADAPSPSRGTRRKTDPQLHQLQRRSHPSPTTQAHTHTNAFECRVGGSHHPAPSTRSLAAASSPSQSSSQYWRRGKPAGACVARARGPRRRVRALWEPRGLLTAARGRKSHPSHNARRRALCPRAPRAARGRGPVKGACSDSPLVWEREKGQNDTHTHTHTNNFECRLGGVGPGTHQWSSKRGRPYKKHGARNRHKHWNSDNGCPKATSSIDVHFNENPSEDDTTRRAAPSTLSLILPHTSMCQLSSRRLLRDLKRGWRMLALAAAPAEEVARARVDDRERRLDVHDAPSFCGGRAARPHVQPMARHVLRATGRQHLTERLRAPTSTQAGTTDALNSTSACLRRWRTDGCVLANPNLQLRMLCILSWTYILALPHISPCAQAADAKA